MLSLTLGLFATASAQDWGTSGAWQRVTPVPGTSSGYPIGLPPPQALHHAAYVPGYLLVPGNVSVNNGLSAVGAFDLWMFNIANNTWINPYQIQTVNPNPNAPNAYSGGFPPLPFIFSHGGLAVIINEQDPSILYYVDTGNQQPNFPMFTQLTITTPASMLGRVANRFLNFGSTLYALGGWNPQTGAFSNDLYALDLAAALTFTGSTGTAGTWIQISPPVNAAGVVPGYPFPRVGYSVTTLHVGAVMYGGVSRTLAGASPFDCLIWRPTAPGATPVAPPIDCIFHHHMFHFYPGMGSPLSSPFPTMPAQAWVEGNSFTGVNGLIPAPRALHTAGSMGDQMYIYGGITAQGPSSELWAYNLVSETWALVSQSGSMPFGFGGVGCVIGRRLYFYENPSSSDPTVTGNLYTWSPSASFTPSSGAASTTNGGSNASTIQGHTAGIVIGILVGLSNLWLLFKLAENSGVEIFPAFITNALGVIPGCKSGGGSVPSTSGDFYSQVSSSSAPSFSGSSSNANYAPPPPL